MFADATAVESARVHHVLHVVVATAFDLAHHARPGYHGVVIQGGAAPPAPPAPDTQWTYMNERLRFLWEQYAKMVELMITLITGALAIATGLVKLGPREAVVHRGLFLSGLVLLLVALVSAVTWRVLTQLFMEQEVFGNPDNVAAYYQDERITHPFTTSYTYVGKPISNEFIVVVRVAEASTALGFIAGMGSLALFAFFNLPEPSRAGPLARRAHARARRAQELA